MKNIRQTFIGFLLGVLFLVGVGSVAPDIWQPLQELALADSLQNSFLRHNYNKLKDSLALASLMEWKDSVNGYIDRDVLPVKTKNDAQSDSLQAWIDSVLANKGRIDNIDVNTAKLDSINSNDPWTITVTFPQADETFSIMRAPYDMEIISVYGFIRAGGGDDNVKVNIRSGTTPTTATTELFYGGSTITSLTGANLTGDIYDQYIDAGNYVWIYIYSVTNGGEIGVSEVSLTITVIEKQ